mmetsp:Transcript_12055/g.16019  ORF Transcript_12055/g.16019 Transcript_12055/m.16019 type:complete len:347 (+) Transcript_12055:125-1165(+)|eukprot:CAMPEP_0201487932 /NCGR_PEP_ID=MMETSP0151_2-20130828/16433_1 /ASSEMBLY_ACC=CAM_ASM_000257 /TAXON_ID=200890 /ORGANISM="Paramoeba atlantica, Strain 621/1 / CCAP 1560/9" /LENGTH=346 /DNA_ID=CAMNT_0047873111 /DNA_START=117 /DNA_END=1157 /DNA_ORIENTATION=-
MATEGVPQSKSLLYVGFNQDDGCFACGTEKGFIIYNCDPLKERFRRDLNGGIAIVEMLFRCNILALVGGGKNPKYPPNKVMIWDDYQNKCIAELEFRTQVKAVRLRKDRIVVALDSKVYVYNFTDLQLIHSIETSPNPTGILALSPKENGMVLVCPGTEHGKTHIELYDLKQSLNITTHETNLAYVSLNMEGTLLATASEKGTLIRIFETASGNQTKELRRGSVPAAISSLKFSSDSRLLLVSSEKGTVHFFSVSQDPSGDAGAQANQKSFFSSVGAILPSWVSSEWSFLQYQLPPVRNICAFGPKNSIIAICMDGSFYKISYDLRAKETKTEHSTHLKNIDENVQ